MRKRANGETECERNTLPLLPKRIYKTVDLQRHLFRSLCQNWNGCLIARLSLLEVLPTGRNSLLSTAAPTYWQIFFPLQNHQSTTNTHVVFSLLKTESSTFWDPFQFGYNTQIIHTTTNHFPLWRSFIPPRATQKKSHRLSSLESFSIHKMGTGIFSHFATAELHSPQISPAFDCTPKTPIKNARLGFRSTICISISSNPNPPFHTRIKQSIHNFPFWICVLQNCSLFAQQQTHLFPP